MSKSKMQGKYSKNRDYEDDPSEKFASVSELTLNMDRWKIKGRITKKSEIKKFHSAKGTDGEFFSIDIADINGEEIRGTFFNSASNKFYDHLQQGKVYSFANGTLKENNQKFKFESQIS